MDVQVKIQGVNVVRDVLAHLPPAMQKKALRPAMKTAMRPMRANIEKNMDSSLSGQSTGLMRKSLRVYALKTRNGVLRTAVMIKRGLTYPGRFYKGAPLRVGMVAGVFEYGSGGGKRPPQPPRNPFRNAARESVGAVFNALQDGIKKNLEKAINAAKSRQP